jgi:glycogen debranching enzyme
MNDQVTAGRLLSALNQPYLHDLVTAVSAPAMSLSERTGQIRPLGAEGLYVNDLRVLSRLEVTVDGVEPVALGYELCGGADNRFDSALAPHEDDGPAFILARRRELGPAGMVESFTVKSYAATARDFHVEVALECDLAAISTVKAGLRPAAQLANAARDGLVWEVPGQCSVRASTSRPNSVNAAAGSLGWDIRVEGGQSVTLQLAVEFSEDESRAAVLPPLPGAGSTVPTPQVSAIDERLRRWVELSVADVNQLQLTLPDGPAEVFLAAGAPWYLTLFGRDSIWAARMLLPVSTELALGTLRALARRQGHSFDPQTGEQPGKVLHEVRRDTNYDATSARLHSLPAVYYGTIDATPLWVCLLHDAWRWGLPEADVVPLLGPMRRCLDWLADTVESGGGFVRYIDESGQGLANQGWKDSSDAIQSRDGQLARPPIALCEVQGYAHEAAVAGAELLAAFALDGAERWRQLAGDLADRFRSHFWVADEEGPYPAIALQDDGTPVDSLSSNIGHLLGTGLLSPEESTLVARRLGGPELNSGFGLRTLATSSLGYNPFSYHRGSVWPHDTTIAIRGLARTGGEEARNSASLLIEGLLSAAEAFDYRLPELYSGCEKAGRRRPPPYPASCHPQAWTAASSIAVLAAQVGISPDVPNSRIVLAPLSMPTGLRSVHGFRTGAAKLGVQIGPDGTIRVSGAPAGTEVLDASGRRGN